MEANDLEKNDNFNVCGQKYLNRGSWRETNHDLRKWKSQLNIKDMMKYIDTKPKNSQSNMHKQLD